MRRSTETASYSFKDALTHETAYSLMLFAQCRQLHRAVAELLEQTAAGTLPYAEIARHWEAADDIPKAVFNLEMAGELARALGGYAEASCFLSAPLALNTEAEPGRSAGAQLVGSPQWLFRSAKNVSNGQFLEATDRHRV